MPLHSAITLLVNLSGKPDAGNPHVRFDEGDQTTLWSLLYRGVCVSRRLRCSGASPRRVQGGLPDPQFAPRLRG